MSRNLLGTCSSLNFVDGGGARAAVANRVRHWRGVPSGCCSLGEGSIGSQLWRGNDEPSVYGLGGSGVDASMKHADGVRWAVARRLLVVMIDAGFKKFLLELSSSRPSPSSFEAFRQSARFTRNMDSIWDIYLVTMTLVWNSS